MLDRREYVLTMSAVGLMGLSRPLQSDPQAETEATTAAWSWLALVDDGKHVESWDRAAQHMKDALTKDEWRGGLRAVRIPLGRCLSRRLMSRKYVRSLPSAPDGKYLVIQFATSFEKKKDAVETVVPMMEADGHLRVSGYFIR